MMITHFDQLDLSKQYSYADYPTWTFEDRVELIKGWIYKMSPAPRRVHQEVLLDLGTVINIFLKNKPCKFFYSPF